MIARLLIGARVLIGRSRHALLSTVKTRRKDWVSSPEEQCGCIARGTTSCAALLSSKLGFDQALRV